MAAQDFTIEDLLADAQSSGTSPAETAVGLRKWREDMAAFGRTKHEPEEYWNRLEKLDQDLAPVLESLREQQGTSIIKNEVPAEQRSFFLAQYAKAKGDPAAMDPAFQETTTKLNGLTTDRTFSGNDSGFLTLSTDDGKPLADATINGSEVLVRPLKEGGKPFILPIKQYTREELDGLAAGVQESIATKEASVKRLTDLMPYTGKEFNQEVQAKLARELADEKVMAQVYKTGDPVALATLDIGKAIKADDKLMAEVADKSLADRFQAGLLRASINTTRALGDASDFLGGNAPNDIFSGFEEALTTTNEDTARSFRPTTGEKVLSSAAESLGQMAPALIPYGAAMRGVRGASATELGAASTMAPGSYGGELGQMLASAKEAEEGGDPARAKQLRSVARWSSLAQAAIDTGTEMIFGETAALMKGGKGAAVRLATAPVKEGLEEVAAGTLERGVKEPAFYPEDMQAKSLGEGAATEFAAGALSTAPIQTVVEGPRIAAAVARRLAVSAAPDPQTAAAVEEIYDMAADLASLDLPEEGTGGVPDAATQVVVPPPAPAQVGEEMSSPLTTPESEASPPAPPISYDPAATAQNPETVEGNAPATAGDGGATQVDESPLGQTPPAQELRISEETLATPLTEQESGAPPETNNPAEEGSAPGGVVDPGMPTEEPATGSSAPAFSNEQVPPVPEIVNPVVDMEYLRSLKDSSLRQELTAYSPEERAAIAAQIGAQDATPAGLAKALRYEQHGPQRFSAADPAGTGSMTETQARTALGRVPRNVSFINDTAARTPWGTPWAGQADKDTGRITLNLAYIKDAEDLQSRLKEEMLHLVWEDGAVRGAVATLEAAVTPAMREEMARLGYEPGMLTEEAATRMVDKLTRTPDGRSAWRRFVDAVRSAFRRLFRFEPDARQVEDAARAVLRQAMSDRSQSRGGNSRFSADDKMTKRMNVLRALLDCLTAA